MSDIYPRSGKDYVEAYPIVHRKITPGLFYVLSGTTATGSEPEWPVWPPEDQPGWFIGGSDGKEIFIFYNDMIDGFEFTDYTGQGLAVYYAGDNFGGNHVQAYRRHHRNPSTGFETKLLLSANGRWIYDLSGFDLANVVRAEWVVNLFVNINLDNLPLKLSVGATTSFDGWRPSWQDHQTFNASTASIIPDLTMDEIQAMISEGEHQYWDHDMDAEVIGWTPFSNRFAFPINAAGLEGIRNSGGELTLVLGYAAPPISVSGTATIPTNPPFGAPDANSLFAETQYWDWDDWFGTYPAHVAGITLPHLRLWTGAEETIAGSASIGYATEGNIRLPQREPLAHSARWERDY